MMEQRKVKNISQELVDSAATTNEVTLNAEYIVDRLDSYESGEYIKRHLCTLDGVRFILQIYPNGCLPKESDVMPIFINIEGDIINDNRSVLITMEGFNEERSDDGFHFEASWKVKEFGDAGRGTYVPHSSLKESKKIEIKISLAQCLDVPHDSYFDDQLKQMYAFSKTEGDITLVVKSPNHETEEIDVDIAESDEPIEIKVSSVILRSGSKVFDNMLSNGMREKNENKIEVFAQSVDDVNAMIYFMCTNELPNERNAHNLIHLAHYYQMDRLFSKCINDIVQTLSVDNFGKTLNIFDKYEIENGYKALVDFAKENKTELKKSKNYDQIPFSFKCTVLNTV